MSKYDLQPIDFTRLKTIPLSARGGKVRVEDFATEEVLRELKLESPFDLMGLYQGVSFEKKSVMDVPRGPDMVFLYRRPLLDYWAEGEETLGVHLDRRVDE